MNRVQKLPDDLANQIAAGEVVERPASIVKELVENALDAGATRITVDIEDGGVGLVRVADDGFGMDESDATLAVQRHATSKIRLVSDLLALGTFGFRGEALPSIASVSRFALETARRGDEAGTAVRIEAGIVQAVEPIGRAPGTTLEVRDLFFNVPARRKFLKARATESAHVGEVVEAMALSAPGVTMTLRRDGRTAREYLRAGDRNERAKGCFLGEELAELRGARGDITVLALLGRPEKARASGQATKLFVNGRLVRDRSLLRTVLQSYGSVLPPGRFPVGAVFVEVPPGVVDVNVHPQKAEVRFSHARDVYDAVFHVISLELGRAFGIPAVSRHAPAFAKKPTDTAPAPSAWDWTAAADTPAMPLLDPKVAPTPDPWGLGAVEVRDAEPSKVTFSRLRFLAQTRGMFLVCEGDAGLVILDQHAAAERVTFDRLKRQYAARAVAVQPLLFPLVIDALPDDVALVEEDHAGLLAAGMDVRVAGPRTIAVHGIPQLLRSGDPTKLVRDLLAEKARSGDRAFGARIDLALATMACHGSIRAGERVSPEEAQALLAALDDVDFAGHCPHGRPIVTLMRWDDLERKVGRR